MVRDTTLISDATNTDDSEKSSEVERNDRRTSLTVKDQHRMPAPRQATRALKEEYAPW